jgi:hypothetical protein
MERDETYYIEGLYEELPAEVYYDEDKAIERLNELHDMHNKALGHVLPTMYREVVVTRHEYWNPKTEEWEDE